MYESICVEAYMIVQKSELVHASPVLLWWFKAKRDYGGMQR